MEGRKPVGTALLDDPVRLQAHIVHVLERDWEQRPPSRSSFIKSSDPSSVMLLLGLAPAEKRGSPEVAIILNKRSRHLRQGGDLCCPGGSFDPRLDPVLARLLSLPGFPLARWPHWPRWRSWCPEAARELASLLATALRECFEEIRLNPLGVRFLGPLPAHCLAIYDRVIHPMVGWVVRQKRYRLNHEVEKIIAVPIRSLLDPSHYARYRLYVPPHLERELNRTTADYPCFVHRSNNDPEILWGVTFRMVGMFMERVFGFIPPDTSTLPFIPGLLDEGYLYGRK